MNKQFHKIYAGVVTISVGFPKGKYLQIESVFYW